MACSYSYRPHEDCSIGVENVNPTQRKILFFLVTTNDLLDIACSTFPLGCLKEGWNPNVLYMKPLKCSQICSKSGLGSPFDLWPGHCSDHWHSPSWLPVYYLLIISIKKIKRRSVLVFIFNLFNELLDSWSVAPQTKLHMDFVMNFACELSPPLVE